MNAAEEVVTEELSPSEELFTAVVLGQDKDTAATCFVFTPPRTNLFAKTCKIENKFLSFVI